MFLEKCRNYIAGISGVKGLVQFIHVVAVFQGLDDRGISRGSADTALFKLFDQHCFRISRRRLRLFLFRIYFNKFESIVNLKFREDDILARRTWISFEPTIK